LERVKDYWGAKVPTAIGLSNFDSIRTEYYRDATVALEAFKAGQVDWRIESSAKNWATAYDFPAMDKGLVKKEAVPTRLPNGMQGYAINTRRKLFTDRRVRAALIEVFDFEWMNKNLFYDNYTRTTSYFSDSDFASSGLPTGDELKMLEKYRDKLPPEIFTKPYKLPVTDGSGNNRAGLRRALDLLKEAGWTIADRKLVNAKGEPFRFEILLRDPAFERIALPYVQSLERLGMDVRVRTVDAAQYQRLLDSFDYDMTDAVFAESDSPGNEQMEFWSCASAKMEGSNNTMGICDPVVDALVGEILAAHDRPTQVTATRALDRVLLAGHYMVPQWHLSAVRLAYWDRFGRPSQPVRSGVEISTWWLDQAKAAVTDPARRMGQ
jgi:microcin C transport system substrate-binding protein